MTLRLFFRALSFSLELLATSKEVSSSSSHGIRPLHAPLPFDRPCVHSRKPRLPSGRRYQPSTHVPPSWSLTTSTVYSARRLQVCCTLLPAMEFDAFPVSASRSPEGGSGRTFTFPAPRVIPFEEFPSSTAVPHHCGRCPPDIAAHSPCPDLLDESSVARPRKRGCDQCAIAGRGPCRRSHRRPPKLSVMRFARSPAEAADCTVHCRWPKPPTVRHAVGRSR